MGGTQKVGGEPKGDTQGGQRPLKDLGHRGMGFSKPQGKAVTGRKGASPRKNVSAKYFPIFISLAWGKKRGPKPSFGVKSPKTAIAWVPPGWGSDKQPCFDSWGQL